MGEMGVKGENSLEKVVREMSNRYVRGWSKGILKGIDMLWGQVVKIPEWESREGQHGVIGREH